jgi:hypothetical protein
MTFDGSGSDCGGWRAIAWRLGLLGVCQSSRQKQHPQRDDRVTKGP